MSVESKYYEKNAKRISKKYKNKWIAIKNKRVIDSDHDLILLYKRVARKSPFFLNLSVSEVQCL